ncbi:MAG: hypothetical protein JO121_26810 [Deltaproteobacteria bacterium]|nr:hypothetical protein [Deltaproteobacteria bacterium]
MVLYALNSSKQRPSVLQVGGVETLGELDVEFGEHRARFVAAIGVAQQPCEACHSTQLPGFGALSARNIFRSASRGNRSDVGRPDVLTIVTRLDQLRGELNIR